MLTRDGHSLSFNKWCVTHNVFLNQNLFGPVKHKNNNVLGKIKLFTPTFQTSRVLQIPLEIPILLKILLANLKVRNYDTQLFNQQRHTANLFSRLL